MFRGGALVLYCACAPLLCHLCPLCHHDMEGGGGGGDGTVCHAMVRVGGGFALVSPVSPVPAVPP